MSISTASYRLKKLVLFDLVQRVGCDYCHHCAGRIAAPEQLSVEHKVSWLYRDAHLFWDLTNVTFSHLACNTTHRAASRYDRGGSIEQRKAEQLGMAHGTAMGRLRVALMLDLLRQLQCDTCFRCQERLDSPGQLSIEHRITWLDRDPQLFWDLSNIAFSHRRCNSRAASRVVQGQSNAGRYRKVGKAGTAWCGKCRAFLPMSQFSRNRSRWNGLNSWCKLCMNARR